MYKRQQLSIFRGETKDRICFDPYLEELDHILQGCKQKDRASQEKMYRHFYPALFALCRMFYDNEHDILTALNNGMLKVFRNIDKFDAAKGSLFNWVYTVVKNEALTGLKGSRRFVEKELLPDVHTGITDNPFYRSEKKDMHVYLQRLPVNTRTVAGLFYLEGYSVKEITNLLCMKEGTVKWHLSECRSKLKTLIAKD